MVSFWRTRSDFWGLYYSQGVGFSSDRSIFDIPTGSGSHGAFWLYPSVWHLSPCSGFSGSSAIFAPPSESFPPIAWPSAACAFSTPAGSLSLKLSWLAPGASCGRIGGRWSLLVVHENTIPLFVSSPELSYQFHNFSRHPSSFPLSRFQMISVDYFPSWTKISPALADPSVSTP